MATVFLARDLRHDRNVALKVLKQELAALLGAERFLSEIRVMANLQHPNLLPLFDSGESDGRLFYVMPYIEGESLRQRLDREKQLPVDEAIRLAVAICGALDYAHRHGVIHRDLKPENVLLAGDPREAWVAQPLVADFGIALAISNAGGARITQTGISLGTPQYMSPEQATGEPSLDARTDIYSVGALAYEMLTGEPPHTGPTAQAIIAKLLTEDARPVVSLRRSVPPTLAAAVQRALEKLPADRFSTARAFAEALSGKVTVAVSRDVTSSRSLRSWKLATAALAVVSIAAVARAVVHRPSILPTPHLQFSLGLPDSAAIDLVTFHRSVDLSPDGTMVTYIGESGVFLRPLNELTPRRLTGEPARDPRFSPDGAWVAYVSNDVLRKVPVEGGPPTTIVDSVGRFGWGPDGTIVFTRSGPAVPDLWRVGANGGRPRQFVHRRRPNDIAYGSPTILPDGDAFLVPLATSGSNSTEIVAYRFSDDRMSYLGVRGAHPLYAGGGLLLYVASDGGVYADSLDARSLRVRGTPMRVFQAVLTKESSAELAVSSNGTMLYVPAPGPVSLVEIDRTARQHELQLPVGSYWSPRYSPDGRRFVVGVRGERSTDVVVYDFATLTPRRLASNGRAGAPEWTRDGRRVGWTEAQSAIGGRAAELNAAAIFWRAADGSDTAAVVVPDGLGLSFSPAQDAGVVIVRRGPVPELDLVQLSAKPRFTKIMDLGGVPILARISPDGRWLAYQSTATGRPEVYVRRLPNGPPYSISVGGATEPMWNPRGGELFYRSGARLISARLALGSDQPKLGVDTLPVRLTTPTGGPWATYDVSPDGQRFLTSKAPAALDQPIVITGWLEEVREKLKARGRR